MSENDSANADRRLKSRAGTAPAESEVVVLPSSLTALPPWLPSVVSHAPRRRCDRWPDMAHQNRSVEEGLVAITVLHIPFPKEQFMTDVVSFTRMQDGTAEDYALLDRIEVEELQAFPERVLGWLLTMDA